MLDILANASATIAEGEVLQMTAASNLKTDEEVYLQVVRGKTAALFSAATEVGGVIAGAPEDQVKALFEYGDALGIAFQIADDLLDYQGDSKATGKNVGDDFRERKLTLPVIKAVAQATNEERAFWTRTIEKGKQEDGDLEQALALMAKYKTLEATREDAYGLGRQGAGCAGGAARPRDPHDAERSGRLRGVAAELTPGQGALPPRPFGLTPGVFPQR